MSIVTQRIYTGDSIVYVGENGGGGGGVSNNHTISSPGGSNTVVGPFTATSNSGNNGTAHHSLFDANGNSIGYPVPEMPGGPQYVLSADNYGGMAWALFASKIQAALSSSDGSVTFTPTGSGLDVTANITKSTLAISPDSSGNAALTIPADVMVVIGILPATLTGVLTFTVAPNSDDATMAHQYMIDFTTNVSAIPSGLSVVDASGSGAKWVAEPKLSKGKHYQVSVSEGLAIIAGEA